MTTLNKIVIYTSLTGGYDNLPEYKAIDKECSYICFSNDYPANSKIGNWTIKPIPMISNDLIRTSRYAKLQPHKLLSDYDYSVWLDSNLIISDKCFYDHIKQTISTHNNGWLGIRHPNCDCIYEEAERCVSLRRERFISIYPLIRKLKREKYPRHNGLFENNLILRAHNNKQIAHLCDSWWEIYNHYCKRDQLSLFYIFWKSNFTPELLYHNGLSTYNIPGIERLKHKRIHKNKFSLIDNLLKKRNKLFIKLIHPFS